MMHQVVRPVAVSSIVMEASTPQDRKYMRTMQKDDIHQLNGATVQKLYQTTLERKHCDFGDIPKSKGDIISSKYYSTMKESLDVLKELFDMNGIYEPAVNDVDTAINNVIRMKPSFEYGFKTNQEYIIILYNTTVMAIIDTTSMLIASYLDYIVGPNQEKYTPNVKFDKNRGTVALDNLRKFNVMCKDGTMDDVINYTIREQKSSFIGTGAIAVTGIVVTSLVIAIPVTRQLIYWYYLNKNSLSEYLEVQAQFLEMHKLAVENSKARSSSEKREIIKKQERVILKLRRAADKLAIKASDSEDILKKELHKDDSLFTLKEMEKTISDNKMNGLGVQII